MTSSEEKKTALSAKSTEAKGETNAEAKGETNAEGKPKEVHHLKANSVESSPKATVGGK